MPTSSQYPLWLIFKCIGIMLQLKTSEVTPNLATISEDVKIYENTSVVKEAYMSLLEDIARYIFV